MFSLVYGICWHSSVNDSWCANIRGFYVKGVQC